MRDYVGLRARPQRLPRDDAAAGDEVRRGVLTSSTLPSLRTTPISELRRRDRRAAGWRSCTRAAADQRGHPHEGSPGAAARGDRLRAGDRISVRDRRRERRRAPTPSAEDVTLVDHETSRGRSRGGERGRARGVERVHRLSRRRRSLLSRASRDARQRGARSPHAAWYTRRGLRVPSARRERRVRNALAAAHLRAGLRPRAAARRQLHPAADAARPRASTSSTSAASIPRSISSRTGIS